MERVIYVGVFLTPESREKLLTLVPPLHKDVFADHMTIAFRPEPLVLDNLPIGKKVLLRVIAHASNARAQAVTVQGVFGSTSTPHITISVNREAGGNPNLSNLLLSKTFPEDMIQLADLDVQLEGVIDTFPRSTPKALTGELNNG